MSAASPGRRLVLAAELQRELIAHATADLPNECCGMLAGEGERVLSTHPATNTESSPFMYVMDPQEQMRLMDEIDATDRELLGIYHSHTRSVAYPSRTDVELAFYPALAYVIVSLADPGAPEIRAFQINREASGDEAISEIAIDTD